MHKIIKYILVFILFSCTKDKVPDPDNCTDLDYSKLPPINFFAEDGEQYKAPCINPINENEIVYYYRNPSSQTFKLIKYNMETRERIELANDIVLIGSPKWNKSGWLVFDNSEDYNIWIVKDNGDSLKKITQNTANLYPTWKSDGTSLVWLYSPVLGYPYYVLKQNLSAAGPDTIYNDYAAYNTISNDGKLVSALYVGSQLHLMSTDESNLEYVPLLNLESNNLSNLKSLCWSHDSKFIYFCVTGNNSGIYRLNIQTKVYTKLIEVCNSRSYTSIACSPNNIDIYVERVDNRLEKNMQGNYTGKILQTSGIYKINTTTLEERKVDLE